MKPLKASNQSSYSPHTPTIKIEPKGLVLGFKWMHYTNQVTVPAVTKIRKQNRKTTTRRRKITADLAFFFDLLDFPFAH